MSSDQSLSPSDEPATEGATRHALRRHAAIRSEIAMHLVFLVLCASVLMMSLLMRREGQTQVFLPGWDQPLPPSCTTQTLFGVDCPGCGMTRAFIAISHGQFQAAWTFNAASFPLYLFIVVQIPWHLVQIGLLLRRGYAFDAPLLYYLPVVMVAVLAVHWIARLIF